MSVLGRLRQWIGRAKATPVRVEEIYAVTPTVRNTIDSLRRELLGALDAQREDRRGHADSLQKRLDHVDAALADSLQKRLDHVDAALADNRRAIDVVDDAVAEQTRALHESVLGPTRDAEEARLVSEVDRPDARRLGVSVITISWNHAGFLEESVESSRRALAALPREHRGHVLVLDDASTDETPGVSARLAARYPEVIVVRAAVNLGLSRARNVLLSRCETSHAVVVDSDNWVYSEGASDLFRVARQWGATFTYGNVFAERDDGTDSLMWSNEPPGPGLDRANYIDSMALIDVKEILALGGYTKDPTLHAADDYELVHRLARRSRLVAWVPTLVGRYRITDLSYSRITRDMRPILARVARSYRSDGKGCEAGPAIAAHPDLGLLWANASARALGISETPGVDVLPAPHQPARVLPTASRTPRVLVLGSGGVRNLGDDAITHAVCERIRRAFPNAGVDLVTDGPHLLPCGPAVGWSATLQEAWRGVTDAELEAGLALIESSLREVELAPAQGVPPVVHLGEYDAAVVAGGGNLNQHWHDTLFVPRAAITVALHGHGVPVVWSGQGVGPLAPDQVPILRAVLAASAAFFVRDPVSAEVVRDVTGWEVAIIGDDALGTLPLSQPGLHSALDAAGIGPETPYVVLNLRRAPYAGTGNADFHRLAAAVDEFAARENAFVVGLALCADPDAPEVLELVHLAARSKRQVPWRVIDGCEDPALAVGVLANARAAVVHSYHAALFATAHRVPTVFEASSPYTRQKAAGLRVLAGLPEDFVTSGDLTGDALTHRLAVIGAALQAGAGLAQATSTVEASLPGTLARLVEAGGSARLPERPGTRVETGKA